MKENPSSDSISPSPRHPTTPSRFSSPALGWRISSSKDSADAHLPSLSDEEQSFLLDLAARFREWTKRHDLASPSATSAEVERLLDEQAAEQELDLDSDQRAYLLRAALSHLAGFAPLDHFLSDPTLEEIAVIGLGLPIYIYHRKGGWQATNASITSFEHLTHLINKMARSLGRRVSSESPRLNALLPDGSRLHASIPPLSDGELTIRKHAVRPWSAIDLLSSGSIHSDALAFLWLAFQSDSSVLVAGNTASGKTTLLDALLGFVPLSERMVVIEETPELRPPHPHQVHLVCNEDLHIPMAELVRDSLRMRPDRVVVGEVRTPPETQAYMETLLSGQARGSYATFHAQSAPEALRRLVNLGASADDLVSLDFIVIQRRIAHYDPKMKKQQELRRCLGIYMLTNGTAPTPASGAALPFKLEAQPVMVYDNKSDRLKAGPSMAAALERLANRLGLTSTQARTLLNERARFLDLLPAKADSSAVVAKIQQFAYR